MVSGSRLMSHVQGGPALPRAQARPWGSEIAWGVLLESAVRKLLRSEHLVIGSVGSKTLDVDCPNHKIFGS